MRFIIYAPPYDETSGGCVVLHKLCDLLNKLGYKAYLFNLDVPAQNFITNPYFKTPILKDIFNIDKYIVIYPETVLGNPVGAKYRVRWLLHHPGFHTKGKVYFHTGELYFKYISWIKDITIPFSKVSDLYLKIVHYPLEYYNMNDLPSVKKGISYTIRKGNNKKIVHDIKNSICIDNLSSHKEIAEVLKKTEYFISYDPYTALSKFAVLCGCKSIVIPDEGISKEEWRIHEEDRYGIAYGFDDLEYAEKTKDLLFKKIHEEMKNNIEIVKKMIKEIKEFFNIQIKN